MYPTKSAVPRFVPAGTGLYGFLSDLLREPEYFSKSLETRIVSQCVELRNGESETDSNRARRHQLLKGCDSSVPISHPGECNCLVIRERAGQFNDLLSFAVSPDTPVSIPKITPNRGPDWHTFGDARGQNLDGFTQSALSQSCAAETFVFHRLTRCWPASAILG
jgi:hypothetical protein